MVSFMFSTHSTPAVFLNTMGGFCVVALGWNDTYFAYHLSYYLLNIQSLVCVKVRFVLLDAEADRTHKSRLVRSLIDISLFAVVSGEPS